MEYHEIVDLIKEVAKSGLSHFELEEGNLKISMNGPELVQTSVCAAEPQTTTSTAAAFVAPAAPVAEEDTEEEGTFITSPLVGTFYAAPSEDASPYVKVGDTVKKGQTVAIVEAMKLMNEIESDCDGVVKEIYASNATMVEYGQKLFRIG